MIHILISEIRRIKQANSTNMVLKELLTAHHRTNHANQSYSTGPKPTKIAPDT